MNDEREPPTAESLEGRCPVCGEPVRGTSFPLRDDAQRGQLAQIRVALLVLSALAVIFVLAGLSVVKHTSGSIFDRTFPQTARMGRLYLLSGVLRATMFAAVAFQLCWYWRLLGRMLREDDADTSVLLIPAQRNAWLFLTGALVIEYGYSAALNFLMLYTM